jgi:acyl transferase domain-containing protein
MMPQRPESGARTPWAGELLVFAAATRPALAEQVRDFAARVVQPAHLAQPLAAEVLPCAETAGAQSGGAHRLALIADSRQECATRLARALEYLDDPQRTRFNLANRVYYAEHDLTPQTIAATTALLFPGFGAWHPTLVADLYTHFQSVRAWVDGLDPPTRRAILENPQLFPAAAPAGSQTPATAFAATMGAVLAGDLAMHALLCRGFGLQAGAMVGHSYGENAMLLAAGMVDDYRFVTELVQRLTEAMERAYRNRRAGAVDGALLAIPAAAYAALDLPPTVQLALDNCPQQVVLYGPRAEVAAIESQMQAQGVAAFRLPALDQPVHTPQFPVTPAALRALYAELAIAAPATVYSCATAAPFPRDPEAVRDLLSAQWHQPVHFRATIERMAADGFRTFVEVGPGGRLTGFVRDSLLRGAGGQETEILAVASNLESRPTIFQLLSCLAQLFVRGHALDLRRLATDRRPAEDAPTAAAPVGAPAAQTETAAPVLRRQQQAVLDEVLAATATLLDVTDPASLDPELGFFDLGLGSLQAVELVARLAQHFDLPLPQTLAFDYPTPRKLAHHLRALLTPTHGDREAAHDLPAAAANSETGAGGVAIIGIGCRFPGGVDSPAAFWELLAAGRDAIVERPAGRWPDDIDVWLADADEAARIRYGGYLAEIDRFDAAFFGITPREAETLDPQQRLLLEIAWEALEDAAINPRDLAGTATGVFVGISHADYAQCLTPAERLAISSYLATGNTASTAAGRIAFLLGFTGPCLAVDTACSSSLVALHLACQSLRQRECDVALVAGVNLLVAPESSIFLSKAGALSVDGRCKTFDAEANGYVRGEGCGVVVLKRLADAQTAGDDVLALVRGSAVNHDGRTSGLTVPSGPAQQRVVRRALAAAGVAPDAVDFVECHGTATSLGDPIEVQALGNVFAGRDPARPPVLLGSVKTNIGHLEAAAGIAGLIKVVLQLQHGALAPSLHLQTPNPKVDWQRLPLRVCTELTSLPSADPRVRIGGVSSFGISGTNAHAILEAAPLEDQSAAEDAQLPGGDAGAAALHLLTLSARTPAALADLAERYQGLLEASSVAPLAEIAYTSNVGRTHFEERRAVVAATVADAQAQLRERPADAQAQLRRRPRIAFLCSGQGSQYPGMTRGLLATEPIFRQTMEACDAGLRPHLNESLLAILFDETHNAPQSPNLSISQSPISQSPIHHTRYTQPALFAVEYALARLWQAWGVQPDYLLGHSIGEYVAACLAGVFSLADALRLVAARGRLMQSLPTGGAMLAVMAAPAQLDELLAAEGLRAALAIAAINGPASTVLSGPADAVEQAAARLDAAGVRASRLTVSHAFHSALMEPILDEFAAVAATVTYAPPQIPLVTNRTGRLASVADAAGNVATPAYWVRQLRESVHFARGLETLLDKGCNVFLEIGPKPVLIGMGQQNHAAGHLRWLASIQPPQDDRQQMLTSLAALYERGVDIDWRGFHRSRGQTQPLRRAALPTYPFQRERFWIEASSTTQGRGGEQTHGRATAPLLGEPVDLPGANGQQRFEHRPTQAELALFAAYLGGAGAQTERRLPLAALLLLLHSAGRACFPDGDLRITDLELPKPPPWKITPTTVLQTVLTPQADGSFHSAVYSRRQAAAAWTLLASAVIAQGGSGIAADIPGYLEKPGMSPTPAESPLAAVDPQEFYAVSRQIGIDYGAAFQVLSVLRVGARDALAQVSTPAAAAPFRLPALAPLLHLDGAFQALGAVLFQAEAPGLHAVSRIDALVFPAAAWPAALEVAAACRWPTAAAPAGRVAQVNASVTLRDPDSDAVVAHFDGIHFAAVVPEVDETQTADGVVTAAASARPEPLQDLLDAAADEHPRLVMRRVRKLMANILGIPREQPLAEDLPFHQLGVDSLLALRLRNAVQADYWIDIPVVRFVAELSVAALTGAILAQVAAAGLLQENMPGPATPDLLAADAWVEGEL